MVTGWLGAISAAVAILVSTASPSEAQQRKYPDHVVTQCPHHLPGRPDVRLRVGIYMEYGDAHTMLPTYRFTDAHGNEHSLTDPRDYLDSEFRKAKLECRYMNEEEISVSVPGRLFQCGLVVRGEAEYLSVWCASEVD